MTTDRKITVRLKQLYKKDAGVHALVDCLGGRKNKPWTSRVALVAARTRLDYPEILRVFRLVEELGLGRLVLGRKGAETRFLWEESVLAVAKVAKGEADEIPADDDDDDEDEKDPEGSIVDRYRLRRDYVVKIIVPNNLTKDEAARLAEHVRTLDFGAGSSATT